MNALTTEVVESRKTHSITFLENTPSFFRFKFLSSLLNSRMSQTQA